MNEDSGLTYWFMSYIYTYYENEVDREACKNAKTAFDDLTMETTSKDGAPLMEMKKKIEQKLMIFRIIPKRSRISIIILSFQEISGETHSQFLQD